MLNYDFLGNDKKSIYKFLHYFPIYERHFGKFVNQAVTFWEIGVGRGGSVQMWKRYFGPFAKIIGIDIDSERKRHEEDQINICIGDQSDTDFLQSIIDRYGPPDIVLDDGSHLAKHMCASFGFLYDKVSKNGIYMVEDLCCAYQVSWDGGLKREGTFIELSKNMIDKLNARHYDSGEGDMIFANSTYSMCFYDSVVVFEKVEWTDGSYKSLRSPDYTHKRDYYLYQVSSNNIVPKHLLTGRKLVVFGAGCRGELVCSVLKENGISIECYVDNCKSKQGRFLSSVKIITPEESLGLPSKYYVISVEDKDAVASIYNQLKNYGVEDEFISGITVL